MRLVCLAKLAKGTVKENVADSRRYSTYYYISHKYYYKYYYIHYIIYTFYIQHKSNIERENRKYKEKTRAISRFVFVGRIKPPAF